MHLARLWRAWEGLAASTPFTGETNWARKEPLLGAPQTLTNSGRFRKDFL